MRSLGISTLAVGLLLAVNGCGDDDPSNPGGGGSGGTGAQGGEGGSGGTGADGGGGGVTTEACGDGVTAGSLEAGTWDERFTIAGFSGHDGIAPTVQDFAIDTDGSVVAAGRMQYFEGQSIPPLMRLRDGAWEPARQTWEIAAPADGFSAIAIAPGGDLALATADSFGERDGEVWIDDGTGLVSVGAYVGQVRSLAWHDGLLWVAGLFTIEDGAQPIDNLATWDGTTWSSPPGGTTDGIVYELLVDGDELFVGGSFTEVGGIPAANVASYDGAAWTAYDFADALAVFALARTEGGELYAGGAYGEFAVASGLAQWDGAQWQTVGGGLAQYQTRGVVTDIATHSDVVDAMGCFSTAGGLMGDPDTIESRSLARWDGAAWESLDDGTSGALAPWFQPAVCGDEGPAAIWDVGYQRLTHDGEQLIAGGSFAGVDGVLSQAIVARETDTWVAQGTSGLGIGGSIDRVGAGGTDCAVYGVGTFSHVAGEPARGRVVQFAGDHWEVFSDELPRDSYCPALDVSRDGEVAVGCMVFPPDADAVGTVLRREGEAMVRHDLEGLGPVTALAWSPSGALYVAGSGLTNYLARIDGDEVMLIENGFDGSVNQIDVRSDDDIIVAGSFTHAGSVEASRIARFDGEAFTALGDGIPGQVLALARDSDTVYVSSYDEGAGAYLLGAFDGSGWTELATPEAGLTPESYFSFNALRVIDGGILAAGTAVLDDASGRGLLQYRDGTFTAIGGGVGAISVDDLALTNESLWVAGVIAQAGDEDAPVSSVGIARYGLAVE